MSFLAVGSNSITLKVDREYPKTQILLNFVSHLHTLIPDVDTHKKISVVLC